SVAQLTWGDQGNSKFSLPGKSAEWHSSVAVVDKGEYIFAPNNNFFNTTEGKSEIVYIDIDDGSIAKRLDIAEWWVRPDNYTKGGQLNGGPTCLINAGNGLLHLTYHGSCMQQVIDPFRDGDVNDVTLWGNGNGDYIMDRNYSPDAKNAWVCNDYNAPGISTYNTTDANGFSVMPVHALGAASFGVLAPDGTGIGYLAFAGDVTGPKWTDVFVDTGCAYDGLYSDNPAGATADDRTGWYWIGHDSIKGVITNQTGAAESAPSAFSVAQNTPNPFNPATTISFTLAKAGKTTVEVFNAAGQKVDMLLNANLSAGSHSVTWNAAKNSAGVYFYTVRSSDFSRTMKMTLLK
ncbi:MAG: T9SS type A sorting domain-containing protein, partial [Candidatus Latescibacterota bacterium]